MSQYNFLCRACNKEFSKILTISEYEKGEIACPKCESKDVEQRTIQSWKGATPRLERWRKDLKTLTVELKQPRVIDVAPIAFVSGEPVEREGTPTNKFRWQLLYLTNADLTYVGRPGRLW